jgi:formate dehydrogenase major subunit
MTNHWIDIKNSDVIMVNGSNAAENHPISFKWVTEAKEKGAYAPIRSGADIPFLGGMINYILENDLYHRDYVRLYTNATFLVNKDFKLPADLDGVFSGYDPKKRKYDKKAWAFQKDAKGVIRKDDSMNDPFSVFQLLKKHYSRYTIENVSQITGTPKDKLELIYKTFGSTGKPDRVATIMYAMGWTQHTVGTQNIRCMAMVQLLLGDRRITASSSTSFPGTSRPRGLRHRPSRSTTTSGRRRPLSRGAPTGGGTTRSTRSASSRPITVRLRRRRTISATPGSPSSTTGRTRRG